MRKTVILEDNFNQNFFNFDIAFKGLIDLVQNYPYSEKFKECSALERARKTKKILEAKTKEQKKKQEICKMLSRTSKGISIKTYRYYVKRSKDKRNEEYFMYYINYQYYHIMTQHVLYYIKLLKGKELLEKLYNESCKKWSKEKKCTNILVPIQMYLIKRIACAFKNGEETYIGKYPSRKVNTLYQKMKALDESERL